MRPHGLPEAVPSTTSLFHATVAGCLQGDLVEAAQVISARFVELYAAA